MHSILHKIVIETSPSELFQALTTLTGLSSWWTTAKQDGEEITFFFGPDGEHQVIMAIRSTLPEKEIKWQCISGPWFEKGEFIFSLSEHERGVCLHFAHHGWEETDDFYQHCNTKWGFFLAVSLKNYLETGKGLPHPNDPSI